MAWKLLIFLIVLGLGSLVIGVFKPAFFGAAGVILSVALLVTPFALTTSLRRYRRADRGFCFGCGYDVRATSFRCPECGELVHRVQDFYCCIFTGDSKEIGAALEGGAWQLKLRQSSNAKCCKIKLDVEGVVELEYAGGHEREAKEELYLLNGLVDWDREEGRQFFREFCRRLSCAGLDFQCEVYDESGSIIEQEP